ncbi:hypothetical protein QJS65_20335 (plasmid) [Bacillus altitudinis]|uniref:hypothetical protein n=1 Tax=Bacillus altitudinis TaxID=293387 RepID=UPI0024A8034D|nr:hypothetical protein [Bacillus altitudinis]WHF29096.1 hypothetical protein QJS65_20335 [Bacillus altitudinis]
MAKKKQKRKSNLFLGEVFFGTEDREKLFTEAVAPYYTPVKKKRTKKTKEA